VPSRDVRITSIILVTKNQCHDLKGRELRGSAFTSNSMKLTAIIPATDEPPTLAVCQKAVEVSQDPPDEVLIIRDPSIGGPAQARNLGAQEATGDVLVFVDSDVEVHANAFSLIRAAFKRDAELAAVFGSYDDDPGSPGLISDFRNLLHHHVHHEGAGEAMTFWAGLGAIRRSDFLAVGGFDEQRFPHASVEDIELGMRLVANGAQILLDPTIQGKHLKRWTLTSMVRTDFLRRGSPWVRLLLSSDPAATTLNLGWRHRASAAASGAAVLALLLRRPRPAGVATICLIALNRDFYRLLLAKRGWRQAAAGIPLHLLHHLTGIASVPVGVALYVRDRLADPLDKPLLSSDTPWRRDCRSRQGKR
jgi:GT2 family glycosyltransferase